MVQRSGRYGGQDGAEVRMVQLTSPGASLPRLMFCIGVALAPDNIPGSLLFEQTVFTRLLRDVVIHMSDGCEEQHHEAVPRESNPDVMTVTQLRDSGLRLPVKFEFVRACSSSCSHPGVDRI